VKLLADGEGNFGESVAELSTLLLGGGKRSNHLVLVVCGASFSLILFVVITFFLFL
jgi:hypothetical protein